ncbi:hypothetical protein MCAV_01500 [[Mycoplasma] cavipharyngis]|uniref:hypothetical protein n=1 Tax=[Mycoplasma] cavipharyngis TaxID=92757 RepID=UPI003704004E
MKFKIKDSALKAILIPAATTTKRVVVLKLNQAAVQKQHQLQYSLIYIIFWKILYVFNFFLRSLNFILLFLNKVFTRWLLLAILKLDSKSD